jgi:hypothetical protein
MSITRRQTVLSLGAALLGAAAAPALAGIPDRVRPPVPRQATIFLGLAASQMGAQVGGLEVRLHNYGGDGEVQRNASSIRFSPTEIEMIDIPPVTRGGNRYFLNDINLNRRLVRAASGLGLRMILGFESRGRELIGYCRGTCLAGPDSSAVDIHLNEIRVDIVYLPEVYAGGITFVPGDIGFTASIRAGGICGGPDICNVLTNYRTHIHRAIRSRIGAHLRAERHKARIAAAVRPALDLLGIGQVQAVRVQGMNLLITHLPRA